MIPQVAASERGGAQTGAVPRCTPLLLGGVVGSARGHVHGPAQFEKTSLQPERLGRRAIEGESPVGETEMSVLQTPE